MATTWLRKHNLHPRSFLLTNGEVIPEPELEESSTGLKVRLPGDPKTSRYAREIDSVIHKGLGREARERKARYWMPLDLNEAALHRAAGFKPAETAARFDPTLARTKSTAWWSFKHATLPIGALLVVEWHNPYGGISGHQVGARLVLQDQMSKNLNPSFFAVTDQEFREVRNTLDAADRPAFEGFVRDARPEWTEVLGADAGLMERVAVAELLKKVRAAEELDEIQIPDLRGLDDMNFAWLDLRLEDTNVNGQFVADMNEYLSADAGIEKALELYADLISHLRSIGVVINDGPRENQLRQALITGDRGPLTVKIGPTVMDNSEKDVHDPLHQLSVHLPTGTFAVTCKVSASDKNEIAQSWEESVLRAMVTGEKDTLLAYAEAYVRAENTRTTKKIVGRRKRALEAAN